MHASSQGSGEDAGSSETKLMREVPKSYVLADMLIIT